MRQKNPADRIAQHCTADEGNPEKYENAEGLCGASGCPSGTLSSVMVADCGLPRGRVVAVPVGAVMNGPTAFTTGELAGKLWVDRGLAALHLLRGE